ncbi:metal ABC transporter permease [Chlamydia ibidis]|uniref:metal ABC transporter permease n=1 Tax=Chlamydia ibidis TaxID=1405396 RepID=UPI0009C109A2|nr:metal ABC transporter permease [Chlamydia ibidis]
MTSIFHVLFPSLLFPALLAALGASIAGGVIGTYTVVKRIVSISGSISHSILGSIGITLWLQYRFNWHFSPMYGAIIGAIILAFFVGQIHLKYQEREDALIAILWSLGMAIGIIFISQLPDFNSALVSFLFGNILWVTKHDIYGLGILDAIILGTVTICHTRFLALCFDEKYMTLSKHSINTWYFILLILIAMTIVILAHVMGIILMLSMLVLPVSIACRFSYKITRIMMISTLLNIVCSWLGIALSYVLDFPVGPTIAILMGGIYCVSLSVKRCCKISVPSPVSPESKTKL